MANTLTQNVVTKRIKADGANLVVSAGTGDTLTSDVIDTLGYGETRIILAVGVITATGVLTSKLQGSDDNATFTDIANSSQAGTSNTALVWNLFRNTNRYIRVVSTRATANIVIDAAFAELARPDNAPVVQDSTVSTPIILNAPTRS